MDHLFVFFFGLYVIYIILIGRRCLGNSAAVVVDLSGLNLLHAHNLAHYCHTASSCIDWALSVLISGWPLPATLGRFSLRVSRSNPFCMAAEEPKKDYVTSDD